MRGVAYANSAKGKEDVGTRRIKIDCDVDDRLWHDSDLPRYPHSDDPSVTSLFQDAAAAASAAVDTVFGEPWTYQPMAVGGDVNARRAPDPDRAALPITGAYI